MITEFFLWCCIEQWTTTPNERSDQDNDYDNKIIKIQHNFQIRFLLIN